MLLLFLIKILIMAKCTQKSTYTTSLQLIAAKTKGNELKSSLLLRTDVQKNIYNSLLGAYL